MLTSKEDVLSWTQRNGPAWKLYYGYAADESKVIERFERPEESESQGLLHSLLNKLGTGAYCIRATNAKEEGRPGWQKGASILKFDLISNTNAPAPVIAGTGPVMTTEDMEAKIGKLVTERLEAAERDRELKELRARNTELEKEANNVSPTIGLIRFANALIPHAPRLGPWIESLLMGMAEPAPMVSALAGTPAPSHTTNNTENVEDTQKRFEAALDALNRVDADFLTSLELLARCATEKPDLYKMGLNMLKGQLG